MSQNKQVFDDVYTILVEECGASEGMRDAFVHYHVEERPEWHSSTTEWRFGGKLGFGGKFWVRGGYGEGFTIDCYSEDYTEEILKLIESVNKRLAKLYELYEEVQNG